MSNSSQRSGLLVAASLAAAAAVSVLATALPAAAHHAFSAEFDAQLAVAAYCSGVFSMPLHETGFDGDSCGVTVSIGEQSGDIAAGVDAVLSLLATRGLL